MATTYGYNNMSYWTCPRCRTSNMSYTYTCNLCNYSMIGVRDYIIHTGITSSDTSSIQIGTSSPKTEETKINKLKLLLK